MDNQIKDFLLSNLKETKNFVLAQAPDVVQQVLSMEFRSCIIWILGSFGVMVLLSVLACRFKIYVRAEGTYGRYLPWDGVPAIMFPFILLIISVIFLASVSCLLDVIYSPKAVIIQKLSAKRCGE